MIMEYKFNPISSWFIGLELHKIHTRAIYFAHFILFLQINSLKIKTLDVIRSPSCQEHFLPCQNLHKTYTWAVLFYVVSLFFVSLVDQSLLDFIDKPVGILFYVSEYRI